MLIQPIAADPHPGTFGAELSERVLLPATGAQLATTPYEDWHSKALALVR
jgi:hypothetical protein